MGGVTTNRSLGIFWEGEEVDGIAIYGFWNVPFDNPPTLSLQAWPTGTMHKSTSLSGPGWTVWCFDVKVSEWPPDAQWADLVEGLFGELVDQGARVSWGGLEGFFVDPPDLFDPSEMSGGVWAALTRGGHMFGPPGLNSLFQVLKDSELEELRRAASDREGDGD